MFDRLFDWLALKPHVVVDESERFQIPENATIRPRAPEFYPTYPLSKRVHHYEEKGAILRAIFGHPDIHDYLWNRAGGGIPRECCWVVQGAAVFANPHTNIIFAKALGTHDIFMRMSEEHASSFEHRIEDYVIEPIVDAFGCRWVRGQLKVEIDRLMLAAAYGDSKVAKTKSESSGEIKPQERPGS
jgi:hypothetical protein